MKTPWSPIEEKLLMAEASSLPREPGVFRESTGKSRRISVQIGDLGHDPEDLHPPLRRSRLTTPFITVHERKECPAMSDSIDK